MKYKAFNINLLHCLLITISLIYLFINFYMYVCMYQVMVYDEYWFMSEKYKNVNYLGYGDLFWIIISLIKNELIMRIFSFLSMMIIPIIIYFIGNKFNVQKDIRILMVLFWFTFPMAWWYGKLISPDVYALGLSFLGLFFSYKPKNKYLEILGIILMGIAVGLKLSFVIIPFFYFLLIFLEYFQQEKKIFLSIKKYLNLKILTQYLSFLIGFLLATPSILFSPKIWLENITKFSNNNFDLLQINKLFGQKLYFFWEGYYSPSFSNFSISIPIVMVILYLIIVNKKEKLIVISFLFSLFLSYLLVIKASAYFSWYWFPIITLLPIVLYSLHLKKAILIALIVLNIVWTLPFVIANLYIKTVQIYNFKYHNKIETFFISKLDSDKYHKMIAIDPRPSGSGILTITENLLKNKKFDKPTFIIVSKGMLLHTQTRKESIYNFLQDVMNNSVEINFNKTIENWAIKTNSSYKYLGEYKDSYGYILNSEKR